jgi:hexokinase
VVIAIDGSLFRFHPHFKNVMQSRISQMMGINYKFDLLLSEVDIFSNNQQCFNSALQDGSGRGAALVAAVLKGAEKNGK